MHTINNQGTKYNKALKVGTAIVSESELLGIIRSKGGVLPDLSVPDAVALPAVSAACSPQTRVQVLLPFPKDPAPLVSALWTDRFRFVVFVLPCR